MEPGYTATDNYDGDLTASVTVSGSVDHTTPDSYTLRYNVLDSSGNGAAYQVRTVNVVQTLPFDIVQIIEPLGGTVQLLWNSRPGATYSVWCCFDLEAGTWNQEAMVPSQGEATTWTDSDTVCPCKFYKIEVH